MSEDAAMREFARALFADDDADVEQSPNDVHSRPNVVPSEGRTPTPPAENPMVEFARELFGRTD